MQARACHVHFRCRLLQHKRMRISLRSLSDAVVQVAAGAQSVAAITKDRDAAVGQVQWHLF
jgi:hypothetical protein